VRHQRKPASRLAFRLILIFPKGPGPIANNWREHACDNISKAIGRLPDTPGPSAYSIGRPKPTPLEQAAVMPHCWLLSAPPGIRVGRPASAKRIAACRKAGLFLLGEVIRLPRTQQMIDDTGELICGGGRCLGCAEFPLHPTVKLSKIILGMIPGMLFSFAKRSRSDSLLCRCE